MKTIEYVVAVLFVVSVLFSGYMIIQQMETTKEPECICRSNMDKWMIKYVGSMNQELSKNQIEIYIDEVNICSKVSGLDPLLLLALAKVESRFKPMAVHSRTGAMGLYQINPKVWPDATLDIIHNTRAGCRKLIYYLTRNKGLLSDALSDYNGGGKTFAMDVFKAYSEISGKAASVSSQKDPKH